jgi:hypothetical protein
VWPQGSAGLSLTAGAQKASLLEVWRPEVSSLEESKAEPDSSGAWSVGWFPVAVPALPRGLAPAPRLSAIEPWSPAVWWA